MSAVLRTAQSAFALFALIPTSPVLITCNCSSAMHAGSLQALKVKVIENCRVQQGLPAFLMAPLSEANFPFVFSIDTSENP